MERKNKFEGIEEKFKNTLKELSNKYNFSDEDLKIFKEKDLEQFFKKYDINNEDQFLISKIFWKLKEKKFLDIATKSASVAIMARNQSHSIGKNLLLPKKDKEFDEFVKFCNSNIEIRNKGENKFGELFIKDAESITEHPLNIEYKRLRESGLSVIDSIQKLPRKDVVMKSIINTNKLASNDQTLNGSKMGNTSFCMGKVNTILGIIAINEGEKYLNQHFQYAEVIKDKLETMMTNIPNQEREEKTYLNEILNYEDPHQMLVYKDESGIKEIDPNHIALKQMYGFDIPIENILLIHEGKTSDIAYEMYFLNYINNKLIKNPENENKKQIIERMENFNKFVGGSELIIKRLIGHANKSGNKEEEKKREEELKKLAIKFPTIKEKFSYKIIELQNKPKELERFIQKKYGPNYTISDVLKQY